MKMRKWIISVLAVLLVIALAGCATKEEKAKPKKAPEPLVINTKDKKKDYSDKEAKAAEAAKKAKPVLLEPIFKVEVTVPEEYMGDVIGDISSRRGRIEGSDMNNGAVAVRGYVPLSEMFGYATDLRSKTQGRGVYVMQFDHFEKLPDSLLDSINK